MAVVVFYEKPGCSGNAFQKALLEASGHTVVAKDILKTDWMRLQPLPFLKSLPVSEWFNRSAPLVRSGAIDPDSFDASDATSVLSLLIDQPLLIHRPKLDVILSVVGPRMSLATVSDMPPMDMAAFQRPARTATPEGMSSPFSIQP